MLSRLLKEHQARQSERRELQGEPAPPVPMATGPPIGGRSCHSARARFSLVSGAVRQGGSWGGQSRRGGEVECDVTVPHADVTQRPAGRFGGSRRPLTAVSPPRRAAAQGGDRGRHPPHRGPGRSPQRGGGPGLREPAETGPGGEDAAGAGGAVCQADRAVDHHGGELQPGAQGDR
ncbi:hypothetical protein Q9966_015742 [Columba livia]|nr:hypothetical protein Q9966_015742 [Columba livia]